jgi:hypothetical protein
VEMSIYAIAAMLELDKVLGLNGAGSLTELSSLTLLTPVFATIFG